MKESDLLHLFDLTDKVAVVTGGGGVLCRAMSHALAQAGGIVAVMDISLEDAQKTVDEIQKEGGHALAIQCDVIDKPQIENAAQIIFNKFNRVDILINGAGGNKNEAMTTPDLKFFDLPVEAMKWVFDLNIFGTILPSQVFGRVLAEQQDGIILNISSMNAFRPLTQIAAYSAAKAAVSNFTLWLAVHMTQEYSANIRVNSIAPGFFLTKQNRFLLMDEETGELTPRGRAIIDHTPMARFGVPQDLLGTMLWLVSGASRFVTGVVVPVDGGFSAFSGV